jgi:mono/diheme cytochrome c family protein
MQLQSISRTAISGMLLCAAVLLLNISISTPAQDTGAALFKTKCAACHGPDGKGETAMGKANKLRDLSSSEVQKQTDPELAVIIENGKGKMPAYSKSLKADQVKDLAAYIRSLGKK